MASNPYSFSIRPCKWGKRPWRQSPIRKVVSLAITISLIKKYGL